MKERLRPKVLLDICDLRGIDYAMDSTGIAQSGKVRLSCPFHHDSDPSAVIFVEDNQFFCSSCGRNLCGKEFAAELGDEQLFYAALRSGELPLRRSVSATKATRKPRDAPRASFEKFVRLCRVCQNAATELGPEGAEPAYLRSRGIDPERLRWTDKGGNPRCAFGVLCPELPQWLYPTDSSYQIVLPMSDPRGFRQGTDWVVGLQLISVERGKKPRSVAGSQNGVFLNHGGWYLLRGVDPPRRVLLVEGATDFLVVTAAVPGLAIFGTPGATFADKAFGPWVRGCDVVVALDADQRGRAGRDKAIAAAERHGARSVRDFDWPHGGDACDLAELLTTEDFGAFVRSQVEGGGK